MSRGPAQPHFTDLPLNVTACGVFAALSSIVNDPVTVPVTVGANFTEIVQLLPCARGTVQVFFSVKPLEIVMLPTVRDPFPLLLSVTFLAELFVSTVRFANVKAVGLTAAIGT
jgi:hypothetical protein